MTEEPLALCIEFSRRLVERVLAPIKASFVGKDNIVDLMGVCLVGGEHLFLFGPPGTAKSALVHELGRRLHGQVFDYLLTRFTEPNELFGPFDIRKLRDGELVTNTEGMLPEASLVFLDELLNANSAILNSLLMTLNERVFRRGRETRPLPMQIRRDPLTPFSTKSPVHSAECIDARDSAWVAFSPKNSLRLDFADLNALSLIDRHIPHTTAFVGHSNHGSIFKYFRTHLHGCQHLRRLVE